MHRNRAFSSIDSVAQDLDGVWRRREVLAVSLAALTGAWPSTHAQAQPASAAAEEAAAPPVPPVGSRLDVPAIDMLGGGAFDPAATRGKPLLIYWWASTCPFCALQSPAMQQFWERHKGNGLQMLALSIDKKPQDAVAYLSKKGYSFPSAWASPAWRKVYPKPKGLPITLLADRQGRLVVAEKGQMFAEDVEAMARFL